MPPYRMSHAQHYYGFGTSPGYEAILSFCIFQDLLQFKIADAATLTSVTYFQLGHLRLDLTMVSFEKNLDFL